MSISGDFRPKFAHVPGRNARHEVGAFDSIRETAKAGMSAEALAESAAFRLGLIFLEEGYFWEAHEVLEPVWMVLPQGSVERDFVQGLIQLANGCLKLAMARPKAALRLCDIAKELIGAGNEEQVMGLSRPEIVERIEELRATAKCAI